MLRRVELFGIFAVISYLMAEERGGRQAVYGQLNGLTIFCI